MHKNDGFKHISLFKKWRFKWNDDQITLTDCNIGTRSILEECGVDVGVQIARFQDPERPMLRLTPSIQHYISYQSSRCEKFGADNAECYSWL